LIGALLYVTSTRMVRTGTVQVVERQGRYHRILEPGMRMLVPFIERVRATVNMHEHVVPISHESVVTSDNRIVHVDLVLYYQVTDPAVAVYEIGDYAQGVERLAITTLRDLFGTIDHEQALAISTVDLGYDLRDTLAGGATAWGVIVNRVEITAVRPWESPSPR